MNTQRIAAFIAALTIIGTNSGLPVQAQTYYGNAHYHHYHHHTYFQRHPYQKTGLIGAGAGAAAGALLGGRGGIVKGAVLGGGAGLGYQYLKRRGTFN